MSDEKTTVVRVLSEGDKCPDCGRSKYGGHDAICESKSGSLVCRHCTTVFKGNGKAVPKDDLRELIEEWRKQREDVLDRETATDSAKSHRNGVACGMDYCIDELEALLE